MAPTTDELHEIMSQVAGTLNLTDRRADDDRALRDWAVAMRRDWALAMGAIGEIA